MSKLSFRPLVPFAALAVLIAAAAVVGPPQIKVERVGGSVAAPVPGAVLVVTGEHHQDDHLPQVAGRAEGVRGGKRITQMLTMSPTRERGKFGVTKQWATGTPWVLVFTVVQEGHGDGMAAEGLVKVDAAGRIVAIEHPKGSNTRGDRFPRRATPEEIGKALASMAER